MNKSILTLIIVMFITISSMAQSKDEARAETLANEAVEKVEITIKQ